MSGTRSPTARRNSLLRGTYLALLLATAFAALGVVFLLTLTLPGKVTAFAGVQALWWLAAALVVIARSRAIANSLDTKDVAVSPAS